MNRMLKIASLVLVLSGLIALSIWYIWGANIAVLNPQGPIAAQQCKLLIDATLLMLIVIIPVYIIMFFVISRYKEKNRTAKYSPNWDFNLWAEIIWWSIPCVIIIFLSIMTWTSSHDLDPYKPIVSKTNKKPITIQVIALQWKWLFIYPEEGIATINFIQIPEQTPINFEITADAPMNSFWIPQLGGQIYAMPGMKTKLHLIADHEGSYRGSSANLSGLGFAGMTFVAKATSEADFQNWLQSVRESTQGLDDEEYKKLVEPSENQPVSYYRLEKTDLFEEVVMQYMMPMNKDKAAIDEK